MYCSGVYKECAIYTAAVPIELGFFNFLFYMLRRVFDSSSDLLYIFFFFSVPRLLFENVFVFFLGSRHLEQNSIRTIANDVFRHQKLLRFL